MVYNISMSEFKQGDLVKIKDGTEDARMPDHRMGLIVEQVVAKGKLCDVFNIWFLNGETLKFHGMYLEKVTAHDNR